MRIDLTATGRTFGVHGFVPQLTTADLLLIGMLRDESAVSYVITGRTLFRLTWKPHPACLTVHWLVNRDVCKSEIKVGWTDPDNFKWPHFKCAVSGRKCTAVVLVNQSWVRRSVLGTDYDDPIEPTPVTEDRLHTQYRLRLLGQDGHQPARGLKRAKLLEHFRRHPQIVANWPSLQHLLEWEYGEQAFSPARRKRANLSDSLYSTERGLEPTDGQASPAQILYEAETRTKQTSNYRFADVIGQQAASALLRNSWAPQPSKYRNWVLALPKAKAPYSRPKPKSIEEVPILDISTIGNLGGDDPLELHSFRLRWMIGAVEMRFSGLFVPQGKDSDWLYIQRDGPKGALSRQAIQIAVNGTGRRRFVCPFSDGHFIRLFYRNGWFASSRAHNLVHTSQRKS